MNSTIALFLAQDGLINGSICALLGVTLVLVFAVTRVIFVPQAEFVAWSALTVAALEAGLYRGLPGCSWPSVSLPQCSKSFGTGVTFDHILSVGWTALHLVASGCGVRRIACFASARTSAVRCRPLPPPRACPDSRREQADPGSRPRGRARLRRDHGRRDPGSWAATAPAPGEAAWRAGYSREPMDCGIRSRPWARSRMSGTEQGA
jgi:hypothetical protein